LLTGQAISWFVFLFEKQSPILNNFEAFLEAFAEAFGEHDKARWATTKFGHYDKEHVQYQSMD